MSGPPRLRSKMQTGRPRPKTIHVDRRDTSNGTLTPSCGKKGSISNLASELFVCLLVCFFYNNTCISHASYFHFKFCLLVFVTQITTICILYT